MSDWSDDGRYADLYEHLRRVISTICPHWMEDCEEDLVQAALMRVMEIERRSEGNREFSSSYLWRVASSALIDEIRRCRRRREVSLEEGVQTDYSVPSGMTPEEDVEALEIGEAIRDCLAAMIAPRRWAVALYLLGDTVPEAARTLEWTAKKTENLVFRGLKDLRHCLSSKGLEP